MQRFIGRGGHEMSFDRARLEQDIADHGQVVRVVVAEVGGSAPREVGASMTVWADGQSGTIGGGALEWQAAERGRDLLAGGADRVDRLPLGPALGQCCGGHVTLVSEIWDADRIAHLGTSDVVARPLPGTDSEMPLTVRRICSAARSQGDGPETVVRDGWLIEPLAKIERSIWIYGAGHVGRAIAAVLSDLPGVAVTLVDDAAERFPHALPDGVSPLVAANPADAVAYAPDDAEHFVLTYSHALDLEICHRILGRSFRRAGLIGSATKWARFRRRLASLGHGEAQIARIECPIGDPSLGKHPQAITIGVAAELLRTAEVRSIRTEETG